MRLVKNHIQLLSLLSILLLSGIVSCVKKDFDEPPTGGEPVSVTPNTTLAELKALHLTKGGFDKITEDLIIGGQVVMDDRSGNYYKTLVIQDATGGIEIKFNDGYLYNQFSGWPYDVYLLQRFTADRLQRTDAADRLPDF
jgi:hypothetical protein